MKSSCIYMFLGLIGLGLVSYSCEGFLDIEPQQSVSNETVYDSHSGVVNALYGIYERIAGPQLYAGTSVFHSDLVGNSGELSWIGTFLGYRQMNWKSMDPNDATITNKWLRSYQAIDMANNVIENLEVVNEGDRARVEGEAKFLRGIIYFELVRFYALPYEFNQSNTQLGVPLVLTPTKSITNENLVSRATVDAVYVQILEDLNDAKTLLGGIGTTSGANGGRATSTVAAAFLARVYLSMGNWEAAANESNLVVSRFGGYAALHGDPRSAFNSDSYTSEDVFMINQNAQSNAGQSNDGITTFFASLPGLGRGDVYVSSSFFDLFESQDLRVQITDNPEIGSISDVPSMLYVGVGTDAGNVMSSKWGKYDANIPVIRLAEMILTRAEANFRNGSSIGAEPLADINAIRTRSNATALATLTLNDIRDERYRELAFEGHKLHDLRRFRGSVVAPSGSDWAGQVLEWNDGRLVLPIPQRELDVNENLVQNDAYIN